MKKSTITIAAVTAALLASATAHAARACLVLSRHIPPYAEAAQGFRDGFGGEVAEFDMAGEISNGLSILPKLTSPECGVIGSVGSLATRFLKIRIVDKPIVYSMVLNPAGDGITGANITGVRLESSPAAALAGIKKIMPNAKKIGVIFNPTASSDYVAEAGKAAAAMGLAIVSAPAMTLSDALRSIAELANRSDILWMIPDAVSSSDSVFREMLRISLQKGIPIFALSQKHVADGALAALATDYSTNGLQAGRMAARAAGGNPPASMPSEYAQKQGWIINLRAAERYGIRLPDDIVKEAVEAIR